jgi:hypothetical protein
MLGIFTLIKKKNNGSLLIELILGIAIIGIMATGFFMVYNKKKQIDKNAIIEKINQFLQKAYLSSVLNKIKYEVRFYFDEDVKLSSMSYSPLEKNKNNPNENLVIEKIFFTEDELFFKKFIINGKDEITNRTKEVYLIIYPEGHSQEAQLDFIFSKNNSDYFSLVINPFSCILGENDET